MAASVDVPHRIAPAQPCPCPGLATEHFPVEESTLLTIAHDSHRAGLPSRNVQRKVYIDQYGKLCRKHRDMMDDAIKCGSRHMPHLHAGPLHLESPEQKGIQNVR